MNQKIVMCPIHGDNETTKNCPNCRDYEMKKQKLEPDDGDNAEKFGFDYEDQEPSFVELGKKWMYKRGFRPYTALPYNDNKEQSYVEGFFDGAKYIIKFAKYLDCRRKK